MDILCKDDQVKCDNSNNSECADQKPKQLAPTSVIINKINDKLVEIGEENCLQAVKDEPKKPDTDIVIKNENDTETIEDLRMSDLKVTKTEGRQSHELMPSINKKPYEVSRQLDFNCVADAKLNAKVQIPQKLEKSELTVAPMQNKQETIAVKNKEELITSTIVDIKQIKPESTVVAPIKEASKLEPIVAETLAKQIKSENMVIAVENQCKKEQCLKTPIKTEASAAPQTPINTESLMMPSPAVKTSLVSTSLSHSTASHHHHAATTASSSSSSHTSSVNNHHAQSQNHSTGSSLLISSNSIPVTSTSSASSSSSKSATTSRRSSSGSSSHTHHHHNHKTSSSSSSSSNKHNSASSSTNNSSSSSSRSSRECSRCYKRSKIRRTSVGTQYVPPPPEPNVTRSSRNNSRVPPGLEHLKYGQYFEVEVYPNGGASVVHLYQDEIKDLPPQEMDELVKEFFDVCFAEDEEGYAHHVMGIVHDAARYLPDLLQHMAENYSTLTVKAGVLGRNSDIETCTMAQYYEQVSLLTLISLRNTTKLVVHLFSQVVRNYSQGTFRYGPLHQISLVGKVHEEVGGYFPDLLGRIEENPFLKKVGFTVLI